MCTKLASKQGADYIGSFCNVLKLGIKHCLTEATKKEDKN